MVDNIQERIDAFKKVGKELLGVIATMKTELLEHAYKEAVQFLHKKEWVNVCKIGMIFHESNVFDVMTREEVYLWEKISEATYIMVLEKAKDAYPYSIPRCVQDILPQLKKNTIDNVSELHEVQTMLVESDWFKTL